MSTQPFRGKIPAVALLLVFAGVAQAEPGVTADKIIIGQSAGFTGSVAGTVKELTAGAQAYIDVVNARGGVHGRKIVLESMDDGFDPKKTPEVVKALIEQKKVFALFLSRGTPTNEAAYQIGNSEYVNTLGRMKVCCHFPVRRMPPTRSSVGHCSPVANASTRLANSASRVHARPPP